MLRRWEQAFVRFLRGVPVRSARSNSGVPRKPHTDADRALVEHAANFDFDITARPFEDYRGAGAMPERIRVDLPEGGTRYDDPPEAKDRLIALLLFLRKR